MRKTKLLMPLAGIAAIGAIAPIVTLSSCKKGEDKKEGYEISITGRANVEKYETVDGALCIKLKAVKSSDVVIDVTSLKIGSRNIEINFDIKEQTLWIDKETLSSNTGKIDIEVVAGSPSVDIGSKVIWYEYAKYNDSIYQSSNFEFQKEDIKSVTQTKGETTKTRTIESISTNLENGTRRTKLTFSDNSNGPKDFKNEFDIAGGENVLNDEFKKKIDAAGTFIYNVMDGTTTYTASSESIANPVDVKKLKLNCYGYIEELEKGDTLTKVEYNKSAPSTKSIQVTLDSASVVANATILSWEYTAAAPTINGCNEDKPNFKIILGPEGTDWSTKKAQITIDKNEPFDVSISTSNPGNPKGLIIINGSAGQHPIKLGNKVIIKIIDNTNP